MHPRHVMHILNSLLSIFCPWAIDSWREHSIKTGNSVTSDPIKLLAPVHDHDVNDNATEETDRNMTHLNLEGRTMVEIYSSEMNSKNSETKNMSLSHCSMMARCLETVMMILFV